MEIKKNPKVDLESYKTTFFLIGLVFALGLTVLLFNWSTKETAATDLGQLNETVIEEEQVPVTRQDLTPPPPPPPPEQVADVMEIVNDKIDVDDDLAIDTESDEDMEIEFQDIPEEEEEQEEQVFFIVEDMPEFPGGDLALRKWIAEHIRYPEMAKENDIQGKVYVRFAVTKTGAVDQVQIVRGVDPLLDQEAIRVVKSLPKFKPGRQLGKPVSVWYSVPINFQLK